MRFESTGRITALAWPLALSAVLLAPLAAASAQTDSAAAVAAHSSDPRVGLGAGWMDAKEAARGLTLVAHRPRPEGFFNPERMGDFAFANSDLAFSGNYAFQGGYNGFQIWDLSGKGGPTLRATFVSRSTATCSSCRSRSGAAGSTAARRA